jgi:hypothetical protein
VLPFVHAARPPKANNGAGNRVHRIPYGARRARAVGVAANCCCTGLLGVEPRRPDPRFSMRAAEGPESSGEHACG